MGRPRGLPVLQTVSFLRPLTGVGVALTLALAQSPPPSSSQTPAKKPSTTKTKAGATKAKAKTTGKTGSKTASKTTSKTAGVKKSAASKTVAGAAKKSSLTAKAKGAPVRRPVGQQRPTAERYKEIETALHERGYLTESPTGQWASSSVDALRRFQADQDLPVTGHLDSLSLIRLGLGPQRQ